jgi:REP element-mobilizing transposase RayT
MKVPRRRLPRLEAAYYRGQIAVHWTSCIQGRAQGWLSPLFHSRFREALVHAATRYGCVVPVYCLMPDHHHILFLGLYDNADLYLAMRFLRKHTAKALLPARYQEQAYDHVLRNDEADRGAFEQVCWYIAQNPVRAGLCSSADEYAFSGCIAPGFPDLKIHDADFWNLFWRICGRLALRSRARESTDAER